jgi:Zn-dependent protease with chaperone function/gas vesicle protein
MMNKHDGLKSFPEISSRAWEHPADRAALQAVAALPGMNELVRYLLGFTGEASLRLLFLGSAVRVSENQYPRVYELTKTACRVLDIDPVPEVYVTQNPQLNAGAVGADKPFITLNSALVQVMDDQELLGVIAHELGHIASNHVLYKTLLWLLVNASSLFLNLPIGQAVLFGIVAALREWDRKSELSADRAGLLVTQDPGVNYRILMKLAGGSEIGQMNVDEFFRQAADYDASGSMVDSLHKLLNLLGQTHPFPVLRLTELKVWAEGGKYQTILDGTYARREDEPKNSWTGFGTTGKRSNAGGAGDSAGNSGAAGAGGGGTRAAGKGADTAGAGGSGTSDQAGGAGAAGAETGSRNENWNKTGTGSSFEFNNQSWNQTQEQMRRTFEKLSKEFEEAQQEYREEMKRSKDPLAQQVSQFADRAEQMAQEARQSLENLLKGRGK